jgi:hypothetical protein
MVAELSPLPSGLSALYQLFSAPRRCYIIQALHASDTETLTVREVARAIAAAETAGSSQVVRNGQYRNVYNALTQTHLSKLAAEAVIEYDADRKVIAGGTNLRTAYRLLVLNRSIYRLQEIDHRETPWRVCCRG